MNPQIELAWVDVKRATQQRREANEYYDVSCKILSDLLAEYAWGHEDQEPEVEPDTALCPVEGCEMGYYPHLHARNEVEPGVDEMRVGLPQKIAARRQDEELPKKSDRCRCGHERADHRDPRSTPDDVAFTVCKYRDCECEIFMEIVDTP